jgi:hypothetical protein
VPEPTLEAELVELRVIDGVEIPDCEGSARHSPRPLRVVPVMIGPHSAAVMLCPTCASNAAILWRLLERHNGVLPWSLSRRFGNTILTLTLDAWRQVVAAASEPVCA